MPTTYTSLLGLSLPATGELAGTWGTEVNNGITSLLDAAIAGTTTLSTDANVTLTTTTGAANQARQQILLCTGARTAQRTITAPAQSKTYVVINATTGGFAVLLVGVGPTAGITILSGERAVVAWNGSDFVKVSSNLVTGTATRIPFFDASGLLSSAADFVRDSSGNVGIGTASPLSQLHVLRASSSSVRIDTDSAASTTQLNFAVSGANRWSLYRPSGSNDLRIFDNTNTLDVVTWQAGGQQINNSNSVTPPTLTTNGQWNLTPTSNTNLRISYRGSDGVTRVANITLA